MNLWGKIIQLIRERYRFYPGTHWIKRYGFIFMIYLIGPNMYLNQVQDYLLNLSEEMVERTGKFSGQAAHYADEVKKNVIPVLRHLDNNPYLKSEIEWAASYYTGVKLEIPGSAAVDSIATDVQTFDKQYDEFAQTFYSIGEIIRWTSILIWIPIVAAAAPWLLLDLIYGKYAERRVTRNWLIWAGPVNVVIYHLLVSNAMP